MIIIGIGFLSIAVISWLYAFGAAGTAHAPIAEAVYYASLALASLTFALRLLRAHFTATDAADDLQAGAPTPAARTEVPGAAEGDAHTLDIGASWTLGRPATEKNTQGSITPASHDRSSHLVPPVTAGSSASL